MQWMAVTPSSVAVLTNLIILVLTSSECDMCQRAIEDIIEGAGSSCAGVPG